MCRDEVLVYSRIDGLICAEAIVRSLKPPHPDLRDKVLVDFLDHVLVLDDQFEGYEIAGGVYTFVSPSASDKGRLLGIICVGLGNRTSGDKCLEQVALDGFMVVCAVVSCQLFPPCSSCLVIDVWFSSSQLHASVPCTRISNEDRDFLLGSSLLGSKNLITEFDSVDRQRGFSLVNPLSLIRLLVVISLSLVYFIFA